MNQFQRLSLCAFILGAATVATPHATAQETPLDNLESTCPSLTQPISEPLREKAIQYEKALLERATPLCETDAKQANEFYLNGAKQLASFLTSSAIAIEPSCAPLLKGNALLPLQTIPNLNNVFHLEKGFDICAPDTSKPEQTAEPEKTVAPSKHTEKLKTPTPQDTSAPITRERFEMDKQALRRLKSTGAHITPEVKAYFEEMEKKFPPQSEPSPTSTE